MRRLFAIISVLLLTVETNAQETMKLTLQECMDYAMKHNYTIKNSQIDVEIQHAQNNQTLSSSYPHINGKASFTDFDVPQRTFIDANNFSPSVPRGTIVPIQFTLPYAGDANITTSQLLFDGSVLVAWKARNTVMELAKQGAEVTEENVRYNVFKAYNSIVVAYRQFGILQNALVYARSLEHDIEVTRQNGFAEKIDVERTSVQVNNLATDSIRIYNMLKISEDALKFAMGMGMDKKIVLVDTNIDQRRQSAAKLMAEDENYDRVPEYNLFNTQLRLNEYNLERYKLAALPSLSGFWQYGSNYGSNQVSSIFKLNRYWSYSTLGLQLNVPIFNGMLRINQMKEARLNIEKSKNNIDNIKLTIDFMTAQSRTSLRNSILQLQSQRRNMELAEDVLDLAERKYKAGVGSNLEVTQAQTDQLRAQTNYFNAMLEVINAEADLKKALGLLK
jgi:outer membrane protein